MRTLKYKDFAYTLKQSIINAFEGSKVLWLSELNFRIHLFISLVVFFLGFILNLNNIEWIGILVSVGLVLGAESFNTAIEHLCDLTSKEIKPEIKVIKDISAFAVLIMAITSVSIGSIIFLPKIVHIFSSL